MTNHDHTASDNLTAHIFTQIEHKLIDGTQYMFGLAMFHASTRAEEDWGRESKEHRFMVAQPEQERSKEHEVEEPARPRSRGPTR
jgi:hypothetical protein